MKHLVSIIDGTWINPTQVSTDGRYSNAYHLNRLLGNHDEDGCSQTSFYQLGIGSDKRSQPYSAGAFARGLDHQICEAYVNIASNYRDYEFEKSPDKIYIFGFSRGAVVARALAAMISNCGLLYPNNINMYPYIWKCLIGGSTPSDILQNHCRKNVEIECVAVFDTVSGDHLMSNTFNELKFPNLDLPKNIKTAIHILSLDETRRFYSPMLWAKPYEAGQNLEQIWMPGVHSDIGGTYQQDVLGGISLLSMIDRIKHYTKLRFVEPAVEGLRKRIKDGSRKVEINNECVGVWRVLPRQRRRYNPTYSGQWLHPMAEKLGGIPHTYKGKAANLYDLGKFCGNQKPPIFRDWSLYADDLNGQ